MLRTTSLSASLLLSFHLVLSSTNIALDVPFVPQKQNGCGAAVIAMVMSYWAANGYPTDDAKNDEQILEQLYSEEYGGIKASDIESYFRGQNYRAFVFQGDVDYLEQHLLKGRPLIVALQKNGKNGPHHFVVVSGISSDKSFVMINDPAQRKLLKINRDEFEKEWKKVDSWTLLAVPETGT